MPTKILMVCLGNICRSPIAEAVMLEKIKAAGLQKDFEVDSAAIGAWHTGNLPDPRAMSVMKKHGITYKNRARQVNKRDFREFEYIFGMDPSNLSDLESLAPNDSKAKLLMLGNFGLDKSKSTIVDPYYDVGEGPFEVVYEQCQIACNAFLDDLIANKV